MIAFVGVLKICKFRFQNLALFHSFDWPTMLHIKKLKRRYNKGHLGTYVHVWQSYKTRMRCSRISELHCMPFLLLELKIIKFLRERYVVTLEMVVLTVLVIAVTKKVAS